MISEGTTVNLLKRGGQTQKVTQSIRIGNGLCDCQKVCTCKKKKTKRRKAKKNVPLSTFFPNQPVRLIPPQFKLAEGVGLRYANQPAVTRNEGNNPIQNGSNAYTAGAPNAANQGQYNALPALNQLDDMYRLGGTSQSRLIPTMDRNTPRNAALVSGNIPPIKSDPALGSTGPRSESQTTKALKPESRTSHLHNVAAIATARNMGQNPVNAMAAAEAAGSGLHSAIASLARTSKMLQAGLDAAEAEEKYDSEKPKRLVNVRSYVSEAGHPDYRPPVKGGTPPPPQSQEEMMRRGGRRFM